MLQALAVHTRIQCAQAGDAHACFIHIHPIYTISDRLLVVTAVIKASPSPFHTDITLPSINVKTAPFPPRIVLTPAVILASHAASVAEIYKGHDPEPPWFGCINARAHLLCSPSSSWPFAPLSAHHFACIGVGPGRWWETHLVCSMQEINQRRRHRPCAWKRDGYDLLINFHSTRKLPRSKIRPDKSP